MLYVMPTHGSFRNYDFDQTVCRSTKRESEIRTGGVSRIEKAVSKKFPIWEYGYGRWLSRVLIRVRPFSDSCSAFAFFLVFM